MEAEAEAEEVEVMQTSLGGGGKGTVSIISPNTLHTRYCSVLGRRDLDETANVLPQRDQDTQYCVVF